MPGQELDCRRERHAISRMELPSSIVRLLPSTLLPDQERRLRQKDDNVFLEALPRHDAVPVPDMTDVRKLRTAYERINMG